MDGITALERGYSEAFLEVQVLHLCITNKSTSYITRKNMAALHEALKTLSPTTATDFPVQQDLSGYLANCLQDAHVLVYSIPQPVGSPYSLPTDPALEALQKEWKPIKLNAKENPLGFSVFKLSSKDGRGTWFARRSTHEGLGFRRFRAGLQREFEIGEQQGISVRGVGRERQVDRKRCALGQAEVNYLTAQFPGPSAPRDFVIASLTSSAHPDDIAHNASYSIITSDSPGRSRSSSGASLSKPKPRQFTMISRPLTDHPECEGRQGYVRGQFESVEFIREVPAVCEPPINPPSAEVERDGIRRVMSVPNAPSLGEDEKATGREREKTIAFVDGGTPEGALGPRGISQLDPDIHKLTSEANTPPDPEQNPVEWIMITRSDPGGSVPRWMVERGTPGGIIRDAGKFLDWAAKKDDLDDHYPDEQEHEETLEGARVGDSASIREGTIPGQEIQEESKRNLYVDIGTATEEPEMGPLALEENPGLISSALSTVSAGVSMLAPSIISSTTPSLSIGETPAPSETLHSTTTTSLPDVLHTEPSRPPTLDTDSDSSDSASFASFATARSNDPETPSINTISSSGPSSHPSTQEEKALARLLQEKVKLAEKLERQRSRERQKRTKDDEREQKLLEKHMREVEKREARYSKEIAKARKREEKKLGKQSKEQREVMELKKVVEALTKENLGLKEKMEALEARGSGKEVAQSGDMSV